MALGDDYTDEYTFRALLPDAITIKVGNSISSAKYSVPAYTDAREVLHKLSTL